MSLRCLRFCIAFEALGKRHFNSTEICTVLNSLIGQSDEQLSTQAFCQGPTAKRLRVEHVSHILTGERWQNMAEKFLSIFLVYAAAFMLPGFSCSFFASIASFFWFFGSLWSFQPLWCLWRLVSCTWFEWGFCPTARLLCASVRLVHIRVYVKHSMNAGEILRAWYCPFIQSYSVDSF